MLDLVVSDYMDSDTPPVEIHVCAHQIKHDMHIFVKLLTSLK